ncbi:MAG: signal peptidase I [Clostridia bacterium]|nr:signal peptidase I [Clostridia bacterium]MBR2735115.1 signal peptidase I [Clostridia bacterium]
MGNNLVNGESEKFENPASEFSSTCFDWLESLAQALVLVVIVMAFFLRPISVIGTSMLNTLHDADKVIVWKYGYTPRNGDIVVIRPVKNLDEAIIKRVIATEGQTLSIDFSDGSVTVDGEKLDEPYIKERMWVQGDGEIPSVIPEGYCFVMGDNRNGSLDSRFKEVGLIPNDKIIGKASMVIFPFDRFGAIH